jgi:Tol biopolymer transport system component/DNA-binding winged helix-turn-helix (wHTH) protein
MHTNGNLYRFDDVAVDCGNFSVRKNGQNVTLTPRAFDVLAVLLRNSGRVVEKQELFDHVWKATFVSDNALTKIVKEIRHALEDSAETPRYIETVPKRGYRFIADVQEVAPETQAGKDEPAASVSRVVPANRTRLIIYAGLIVAILLGVGFALKRWTNRPASGLKMTLIPGTEHTVGFGISPDGQYLAHVVAGGGKQTLVTMHLASHSQVQLMSTDKAAIVGPVFTPDGNYIYFTELGNDGASDLYKIPFLGGAESRKVLANVVGRISFAPDGKRFAFVRKAGGGTALMLANADGSGETQLAARQAPRSFAEMAWSPDGKVIACMWGGLVAVNSVTGEEKPFTTMTWAGADGMDWLADGSGLLMGAFETGPAPTQIWVVPYPAGEPYKITADLNNYGSVTVSRDGKTALAGQFATVTSLWLVTPAESQPAKPITTDKHHLFSVVSWTHDGRLLFGSSAGGNRDVWIMNADGSGAKQLTANTGVSGMPTATADNRHIVFVSNREQDGVFHVWRMNLDGTQPVRLTNGKGELKPRVARDGKWVVYTAGPEDTRQLQNSIWKVPLEGGEPVQIVANPSHNADVSPDGKFIACWYKTDKDWKIAVVPMDGGPPVKLLDVQYNGSPLRWTPDGNAVSYRTTVDGVSNVWNQPVKGGPPQQVTQFTSEIITNFDWSDDNRLVCARRHTNRDVVLLSNFR